MSDTKCPYCNADVEINHDDGEGYSEDKQHQQTCSECDKVFVFTTFIHFSYTPSKADCLNGGEHNYKLTDTYPKEFSVMRCTDCGYENKPTKPD